MIEKSFRLHFIFYSIFQSQTEQKLHGVYTSASGRSLTIRRYSPPGVSYFFHMGILFKDAKNLAKFIHIVRREDMDAVCGYPERDMIAVISITVITIARLFWVWTHSFAEFVEGVAEASKFPLLAFSGNVLYSVLCRL
jgi:hypothetical protein